MSRESRMKNALEKVKHNYDYVIIDEVHERTTDIEDDQLQQNENAADTTDTSADDIE